ncbi:hypothetical protein CRENBAI_002979 [Crenichthys baileyi]|uniref:Uncharacterized protein n=1 Tax=Crenichthys baileyi TaxID=28760 RepID=A0AAV9R1L5_9TELE
MEKKTPTPCKNNGVRSSCDESTVKSRKDCCYCAAIYDLFVHYQYLDLQFFSGHELDCWVYSWALGTWLVSLSLKLR